MLNEEFDFVLVERLRAENNDLRQQLAAQAEALADAVDRQQETIWLAMSDTDILREQLAQAQAEAAAMRQVLELAAISDCIESPNHTGPLFVSACLACHTHAGHTEDCRIGKALAGTAGKAMLDELARLQALLSPALGAAKRAAAQKPTTHKAYQRRGELYQALMNLGDTLLAEATLAALDAEERETTCAT